MAGELTIVGTGIGLAANMTLETMSIIETADKVLYVVADEATGHFLETLNPTAESIYRFYDETRVRLDTYYQMAEYIMDSVRSGKKTCAAFYGHPGIFVFPAHEALLMARQEGYPAYMKAAVSAEDCLFADLGIDPGRMGCQTFEVTDFLVYERRFDPRSLLILWQVGVIGQVGFRRHFPIEQNISILIDELALTYPRDHTVILYEASVYSVCPPKILPVKLGDLDYRDLTPITTLVVPPLPTGRPNTDVVERLSIPPDYIIKRQDNPSRYNPLIPSALRNFDPAQPEVLGAAFTIASSS